MSSGKIHIVIPDTQIRPGVPTDHLRWIGQYIVDHFVGQDVTIVHLGDHYDMPSLSSYDKGKKAMEGRRYAEDIKAGNDAFILLNRPLVEYNISRSKKKKTQWWPDRHFLLGNHDGGRITTAVENDARLEGTVSLNDLIPSKLGWKVHGFLEPVELDGVFYSHYFYNPSTGKPYSGSVENRLKSIGHSFTQGHQQGLQIANRSTLGKRIRGLIAGSCYLHSEIYRGPQAFDEWRGIVVCHNVNEGNYDLMEVSLDYLCRRYEGVSLEEFMEQYA